MPVYRAMRDVKAELCLSVVSRQSQSRQVSRLPAPRHMIRPSPHQQSPLSQTQMTPGSELQAYIVSCH